MTTRPTDEELARAGTKRALDALYQRQRRRKAKVEQDRQRTLAAVPELPADQAGALEAWAADRLIVPAGHARAGEPMALPDFALAWLDKALRARESILSVARKNGKSAVVAVYLLSRLVGPLRTPGWRGAVISVNKLKAAELRMQMEEIAAAMLSGEAGGTAGRGMGADADLACEGEDVAVPDAAGHVPPRQRQHEMLAGWPQVGIEHRQADGAQDQRRVDGVAGERQRGRRVGVDRVAQQDDALAGVDVGSAGNRFHDRLERGACHLAWLGVLGLITQRSGVQIPPRYHHRQQRVQTAARPSSARSHDPPASVRRGAPAGRASRPVRAPARRRSPGSSPWR